MGTLSSTEAAISVFVGSAMFFVSKYGKLNEPWLYVTSWDEAVELFIKSVEDSIESFES